jgi:glycosidase
MPWDGTATAGFSPTVVAPWLPIPDDHRSLNVESELGDDRSMLRLYIELLRLRKSREVLRAGAYHPIGTADGVLAFRRQHGDETLLIALNFTDEERVVRSVPGDVVLSSELDRDGPINQRLILRPHEGVVMATQVNS